MRRVASVVFVAVALVLTACGTGGGAQPSGGAPAASAPSAPSPAAPASAASPAANPAGAAQPAAGSAPIVFFSSQFKPIEEQEKMRGVILKDAPVKADYIPEDPGPFNDRLNAEFKTGKLTVSLIGGLHGDFAPMVQAGQLEDVSPLLSRLADRGFPPAFVQLARYGAADKAYFVPWMQATYVLAINKKALQYLPAGADVNALTYAQLKDWGAAIQKATNQRKVGFPGGPKGLMHRFFQGYLYPSYTGSAGVVAFKTPEAAAMWGEFKDLWSNVNPQSTNYEFMQEPLLAEEVWIAWDHVARLIDAVKQRPNDFVLVPAPAGPKGRGFMPVLAGLAIPKGAPNRAAAESLIEYLTQPAQQAATLRELAFFPVTNAQLPADMPEGIRLEADAVAKQSAAPDALPSLLPIGLGAKNGEFNKVYLDSFARIVVKGEPVQAVLDDEGKTMQGLLDETKAGCWPPDPPSDGPCKVK